MAETIFAAMHIAVDASNIKAANTEEEQFTLALLYKIIQSHPEHHFTIIGLHAGLLPALSNTTECIITTTVSSYLQLLRWYNKTLPEIIRKAKADAAIHMNGAVVKINIPQVVFLSSPHAAEQPFADRFFFLLYKKYLAKQIAKADAIATLTQLQQFVIAKQLNIKADRIIPVGYAVPAVFEPVSWQQKETIQEEYTNGSEYFLYTGAFAEDSLMLLLKAFSHFKKRQLSSMQLIVAGSFTSNKDVTEKLATYKYRADVKLYENATLEIIVALTSGAYAIIYLDEKALTAFPAAAALQCGVPAIGLENSLAFKAVTGSFGLYASPTPESLAEQMKLLYKDENLRQQLIVNAATQMLLVNSVIASQKFWNCIDSAAVKFRLHLPPENE